MVPGPSRSQEDQGYLSTAKFLGIGAGKPAPISEVRCVLSAGTAINFYQQQSWATALHLSMHPASGRTGEMQEEQPGCEPQESTGFGDSKWGHIPGIEMLSHRLGEHRGQTETKETGVID